MPVYLPLGTLRSDFFQLNGGKALAILPHPGRIVPKDLGIVHNKLKLSYQWSSPSWYAVILTLAFVPGLCSDPYYLPGLSLNGNLLAVVLQSHTTSARTSMSVILNMNQTYSHITICTLDFFNIGSRTRRDCYLVSPMRLVFMKATASHTPIMTCSMIMQ